MAAGKINLQANDGKVLGLYAPDGMSANTDIVPASVNGDNTKTFKVADAINADEAVSKGQLLTEMKLVDGSGSGLDADLLRGLPADFTVSKATNGYQKLPSGLIIQWGSVTADSNGNASVTYPVAFPNATLQAYASAQVDNCAARAGNFTTTGCDVSIIDAPSGTNSESDASWLAIGY